MTTPLVEMRDMSIAFGGIKAVDHVTVDLYPGEVVGLLGHNGAGKSTLIKMLSGAYKPDGGQIFINGEKVTINNPRDARAHNIETIYQTLALADNLDAASNLFLGRELVTPFGLVDDAAMEAETREIMGRLNPNFQKFSAPVSALSGGQRQSVAIARAVISRPSLLLADEPTGNVDDQMGLRLIHLFEELNRLGTTVIIATHSQQLVERLGYAEVGELDVALAADHDVARTHVAVDDA